MQIALFTGQVFWHSMTSAISAGKDHQRETSRRLVFIGIYLGHFPYYQKIFSIRIIWLEVIGRHALIIYLTHQIILFGAVSLTYYLLN